MALDRNTIPLILEHLGFAGEDWGPDVSSYVALAAGWRGKVAVPTQAAMEAAEGPALAAYDAAEKASRPLSVDELADVLKAKGTITQADLDGKKAAR